MAGEDVQETLFKKVYYKNCSGCRVDQYKAVQHGLPIKELFAIWIVVLATVLPISSLFPFLYFMVKDFNIAKQEEDISYYAGFVGSSYMFGRALASVYWGKVADRYGRKPVIIIGTSTVVIFNTLFGLSMNYWMAIITRFLLGSLNGLLGPINVTAAWGTGLIIGPALGGFLAQPADNFPNIFSSQSLFGRFPYFLPCLVISLFALVVDIACFWLPETLHKHESLRISSVDSVGNLESALLVSEASEYTHEEKGSNPKGSLFTNWPLMSSIIVYCVFSLHDMAYAEIFSLWAVSPRRLGGLSFSTEDVGEVLVISGLALLFFQIFLYPLLEKKLGCIMTSRISAVLSIPLLTSYSYIAMLSGILLNISINCASALKNILSEFIVTGLFTLQNRAVDQHRRGAANGISMALMSLSKAVGPAIGGALKLGEISWLHVAAWDCMPSFPSIKQIPQVTCGPHFAIMSFPGHKAAPRLPFYQVRRWFGSY
ncbi:protein ZINC INDUCED FACILITATOR-LIKE 1 isoform X3 [Daucus carota subsp. sativus]|uniref:protein ZINC INDUCED FACILITATOR-LIKE 1 isoform X3 n=1 Tax=Daucus carota subsp. sativus TaxID=79200 RepID=UPI0030839249